MMVNNALILWTFGRSVVLSVLLIAALMTTTVAAAADANPTVAGCKALVDQKKFSEAVAECTSVLANDPMQREAYRLRANANHNLKQYDASIRDYTKALELDPQGYELYWGRAITNQSMKRFPAALEDMTKALRLAPQKQLGSLNRLLGNILYDAGDYAGSLDACLKAKQAALTPENQNCVGRAYLKLGQYEKALQEYDRIIAANTTLLYAYQNRALAHLELGNVDEARKDFDKVFEMSPDLKNFKGVQTYLARLDQLQKKSPAPVPAAQLPPIKSDPTAEAVIVSNFNSAGVQSGPTNSTSFTIKVPYRITYIQIYHYFNKGKPPGTIILRHEDGTMYGPWKAEGTALGGNVPNAYWVVRPNIEIKPGRYTVLDSDQSTWSYNSQSKGEGMIEIRGKQSPQATQQETQTAGSGPEKRPMPVISQQQLIEAVKTFRLEAIVGPIATLKKYSSISTLQDFTGIENALFTETPPGVGWKYYFATATYTVVPLTEQTHVVLFYHPWSDTAIMTLWQYGNKKFVMTHAELLLGDYIRQYGRTPFEVQPLWERESTTHTPLLAVPLAVGETLVALENIFPASGKVENTSPFAEQRRSFDKNAKNKELHESMLAAANLRFERGITALIRYEQDKKLEVYRDSTSFLLASIKMGDFRELKVTIPQTSQETFDIIKANNKEIGLFKVVSVLKTPNDCFVFLSHPADPNNVLVFWFQADKSKYGLRQASFINHIFSASYVSQIRELIAKVSKP
jgi:tetratricopeptide (TPR) repeat protein